jgi:hypothetical protein
MNNLFCEITQAECRGLYLCDGTVNMEKGAGVCGRCNMALRGVIRAAKANEVSGSGGTVGNDPKELVMRFADDIIRVKNGKTEVVKAPTKAVTEEVKV